MSVTRVRGWALVTVPLAVLAGCVAADASDRADESSPTVIDDVAEAVVAEVEISSSTSSPIPGSSSVDEQPQGGVTPAASSADEGTTATTVLTAVSTTVAGSTNATTSEAPDAPSTTAQPSVAIVTTPTTTTALVTTTVATMVSTTTLVPDAGSDLTRVLDALVVAPEGARGGYDRDLFSHWVDDDQNGCDARQDTLSAQVVGFPQVDLVDPCVIIEGDWYSVYDAVSYSGSPSELDVDHVVALAEAWDSGANAWSSALRRQFANDPINLLAVTASSNRSKSDRDVGEWRPEARSAWCLTASMTISVKTAYSLTIDAAERDALAEMLQTCGEAGQIAGVGDGSVPVVTAVPPVSTTVASSPPSTAAANVPSQSCVDINTASIAQLDLIVHVGESRAAEIVALRPFSSVADLTRVSGIGDSRVADIIDEGLACVR